MNKSKLLFFLTLGLLITSLLPIVGNNLPILASYRWLWAPAFILYILLFESFILFRKQVIWVLLYGIIYVWPIPSILWPYANDWYKEAIFEDFYGMLVPVLLFSIYYSKKYWYNWERLSKLSILFIVFTGLMTVISAHIDPLIVRASYSDSRFEMSNYNFFYRLGFGSYGYMAAILSLFPLIVYFLKKGNRFWLNKKVLISFLFFLFIVLIYSQIFANIIVASFTILFSFLGDRKSVV